MSSPIRQPVALAFALGILSSVSVFADNISLRALALRSGEMPEVFVKGPKNHESLRFSAIQPSAALRAVSANPLPLYKSVQNEEGKTAFVVDQKIKLPTGAKAILLLGWTAGEQAKYVAIKDEFRGAQFDDWLLINTTSKVVVFKVGAETKPVKIEPGKSVKYKIRAPKGEGAAVAAQSVFDGKAKTFFSTYWPVHADKRAMVLFVEDGRKIRVKRISDKLVPPKAPGEGE